MRRFEMFFLLFTLMPMNTAFSNQPASFDREADARNCEFFVNSLGTERRHYGGGGYDELILVAYVSINVSDLVVAQGGRIFQVGMRLNGVDDIVAMSEFEPAYYVLRKSLWLRGYNNGDYDLQRLAFFVDVRRLNGSLDRLWLKDGWHDFDWPAVFDSYPKHNRNWGPNVDTYVLDPSPIYHQKHACER